MFTSKWSSMAFFPRPVTMMMLGTPDWDGFLDAVLNDRLVDEHEHFLRLRFGSRQKSCSKAGGGEHGLADRGGHLRIVS